jgi:hypothetical protein
MYVCYGYRFCLFLRLIILLDFRAVPTLWYFWFFIYFKFLMKPSIVVYDCLTLLNLCLKETVLEC